MKIPMQLDTAKRRTSQKWPQYLAVLSASLISFPVGMNFAWPSPSLPILFSDKTPMNITTEEASYVVSIAPLGNILGAPMAAFFANVIGRKNGILMAAVPLFVASIIIAFAKNAFTLCIGRFISGIAESFMFIVYPMYVGEVTEPDIRGFLGCAMPVTNIVGMLAINAFGPFLSIQNSAFIASVCSLVNVAIFIWMPESPIFLIMKGKTEKAKEALFFLQRCDITKQLNELQCDVQRQLSEKGGFKDLLMIKSNRKAMLIIMGLRTIQQLSGISALGFFTQTIFLLAGGNISPVLSAIIYLLTQLIMAIISSFLIYKYGRKPLLILSCAGSGILLNIGGIYFFLKQNTEFGPSLSNWLPICVMVCFILIYSVGLGTVPALMLGELFSASVKGKALCLMCIYYSIVISIVSKLFSFLLENCGLYAAFFMFGVSSLLSVIFSYYYVPETKGKTLEDIQQYLKGNCEDNNNGTSVIPA